MVRFSRVHGYGSLTGRFAAHRFGQGSAMRVRDNTHRFACMDGSQPLGSRDLDLQTMGSWTLKVRQLLFAQLHKVRLGEGSANPAFPEPASVQPHLLRTSSIAGDFHGRVKC
ncbi:hypothetical protein E3N88_26088 [Mikania micrantha]|uniref:Uncharacterized protein n=1 Tax=Mikania micrantha TaxID=192012 RepID=A0A5N6N6L0_9ASTR|nr:hypothetical protein E3N88_26088 [Mikania micrantha]